MVQNHEEELAKLRQTIKDLQQDTTSLNNRLISCLLSEKRHSGANSFGRTISDLTDDDAIEVAKIHKYDIPDDEGVKQEIINIYTIDDERLTLDGYLPVKLYLLGLRYLLINGYNVLEQECGGN